MSTGEFNLNAWLRKTPQPVAVMATDSEGNEHRVEVGKNGRAWRDLTKTIEALQPCKLTCLNAGGSVLRSIVVEVEGAKSAATPGPKTELQVFATLLAEAYDKAHGNFAPVIGNQTEFIDRQSTRLARAEAENDRLRAENAGLRIQVAELMVSGGDGDGEESVLGALAAGFIKAQEQKKKPKLVPPAADATKAGGK